MHHHADKKKRNPNASRLFSGIRGDDNAEHSKVKNCIENPVLKKQVDDRVVRLHNPVPMQRSTREQSVFIAKRVSKVHDAPDVDIVSTKNLKRILGNLLDSIKIGIEPDSIRGIIQTSRC